MRKTLGAWAVVLGVLCVHTAHAQFWERVGNPTITVPVEHPPSLNLNVDRIVFGPATGQCSEEIVHALVTDFVSNGLDVIDREYLRTILAEHDLALSGHVDQSTALEMGRMLGPSAMVAVSVQLSTQSRNVPSALGSRAGGSGGRWPWLSDLARRERGDRSARSPPPE